MLKGVGVSSGIGIGKAVKYITRTVAYADTAITDTGTEKNRFRKAVCQFVQRNEEWASRVNASGADGEILRSHIAILNDPWVLSHINMEIDAGKRAERAVEKVCDKLFAMLSSVEDRYMRQRTEDIADIKRQLIENFLGMEDFDLKELPPDTVLITEVLTPAMMAEIDVRNIAAIVVEKGGVTSHSAIISRALKIPAVLNVNNALREIVAGTTLLVDGGSGDIYTNFDNNLKCNFLKARESCVKKEAIAEMFREKKTVTADGIRKELLANIGSPRELAAAIAEDAEGIGLFRTEFLFITKAVLPSEEEQFKAYKAVAVGMKGRKVRIRTLDVGGDKDIPCLKLKKEENPLLGFRAIRYCLENRELYRTQLRAILRASAYGNVAILIPMITRVDEILKVRAIIQEIKKELDNAQIPYKKDIEVGIMIETPAACLTADLLAEYVDFFSIGTNDLTGYILAADRGNADVSSLYSVFDPAVIRGIKYIIACAKKRGIPCGMCGEAAADIRLLPLLVAFGLDALSVDPSNIFFMRAGLSKLNQSECNAIAKAVFEKKTEQDILLCLTSKAKRIFKFDYTET